MLLHILHTASGCIIVLALLGKLITHYYLDHLHNRNAGLSSVVFAPLQYILPYKGTVTHAYSRLKYYCNLFLILAATALLVNIIAGICIYFM